MVEWGHFDQSHDNRAQLRALQRMVQGQPKRRFVLRVNRDPHATWSALEAYHRKNHGSNWLTSKYLVHSLSSPASVNFKLHCVEMFDIAADGTGKKFVRNSVFPPCNTVTLCSGTEALVAGEIGFSVGRVYVTSPSRSEKM